MTNTRAERALTQEDVEVLLEDLAVEQRQVDELRMEVTTLKREVEIWQKRSFRAEQEAMRWKTTADEWRHEFMKRGKGRS